MTTFKDHNWGKFR